MDKYCRGREVREAEVVIAGIGSARSNDKGGETVSVSKWRFLRGRNWLKRLVTRCA